MIKVRYAWHDNYGSLLISSPLWEEYYMTLEPISEHTLRLLEDILNDLIADEPVPAND